MSRLLTITFTTAAFGTEAAYGSLKPPPTRRLRRAHLHLSYSMALARLLDTIPTRNSIRARLAMSQFFSLHRLRRFGHRLCDCAQGALFFGNYCFGFTYIQLVD